MGFTQAWKLQARTPQDQDGVNFPIDLLSTVSSPHKCLDLACIWFGCSIPPGGVPHPICSDLKITEVEVSGALSKTVQLIVVIFSSVISWQTTD